VIVGRPLLWQAEVQQLALHALGFGLLVVAPGWVFARWLFGDEEDALALAGWACTLGFVVLVALFAALQSLGLGSWVVGLPAVAAVLHFRRRGRRADVAQAPVHAAPPVDRRVLGALALLAAFVALRSPLALPGGWSGFVDQDLWFHAGNAAALARALPFDDPRLAGEPLSYHFFSYVPWSALNLVARVPVEALVLRVASSTLPLMLLFLVFNAGRALGRSPWAGILAAAFVMLQVDPGFKLGQLADPAYQRFSCHSYLKVGIFHSPTTGLGLSALAALAWSLQRWFEHGRARELVLVALCGVLASGAKGSVMPVVLAGLALAALWCGRSAAARRAWIALGVLALAVLPMTLWIAGGESSYARSMFRFELFSSARTVGFVQEFALVDGQLSPWRFALMVPLWLLGYLGPAGWFGLAALWFRRRQLEPLERFLAAVALCGLAAACLLKAPGESQLFFAYDADLALALLGAAALARVHVPRRAWLAIGLVWCVPVLAALGHEFARTVRDDLRTRPSEPPEQLDYRAALEWIRDHAPRDAAIVAWPRGMHASVLAERAAYYETEAFSSAHFALAWESGLDAARLRPGEGPQHFAARRDAQRAFFANPSPGTARAMREQVGDRPLWIVFERLDAARKERLERAATPPNPLPTLDPANFELQHENRTARIYRLIPD